MSEEIITELSEQPTDDVLVEKVDDSEVPAEQSRDELIKAWLSEQGLDPDSFDAKKVANLDKWERDLNRKSTDLGAIAAQLESAKATPKADESDDFDFDPDTLKQFEAALAKTLGVAVSEVQQVLTLSKQSVVETAEATFSDFVESHNDVEPADLIGQLMEQGINPETLTPVQLKRALDNSYKVIKASRLDVEALKKQAVADYLDDLKKKGVKEEEIVEVKKGRGTAAGGHKSLDDILADPNVTMAEKMEAIAAAG